MSKGVYFTEKFDVYKKPLKHKRINARAFVNIEKDPTNEP